MVTFLYMYDTLSLGAYGTAVLSLRNIHIIAQTKASTNKNTHKNQGLIFFINNLITSRLKKTAEKNARITQIISKISFCW